MLSKYNFFELWFGQYRLIRKLSKSFWVRLEEKGYYWVKMDKNFFYSMKFRPEVKFQIEDYTK